MDNMINQAVDVSYELRDILEFFDYLGGEDAITSVSCLIEDYTKKQHDECLIAQAATSTMRLYTNALLVRDRIQQLYNKFHNSI